MYMSISICAECVGRVVPQFKPSMWAYARASPEKGCWVCGATNEQLAPISLDVEEIGDTGDYQLTHATGNDAPVFRVEFGNPINQGDTWERDEDEE